MRVAAVVCLLTAAAAAQALGSVATHREAMQARAGYGVLAETGTRGTAIRRYVSPAGVVFGIAWQGPAMPDLKALLGPERFAAYQLALAQQPPQRRRGPLLVQVGTLVVENTGHMRAFRGRVLLNDAVPAGVSAAVVR